MESDKKDFLVSRILSGAIPLKILGKTYLVKAPSRSIRAEMLMILEEVREELVHEELFTESELRRFLIQNSLWSDELEKEIEVLEKNIDEFKVQIYKNILKSRQRNLARKGLKVSRNRLAELTHQKHQYDYLTQDGVFALVKSQLNIYSSLYYRDSLVFEDFWKSNDILNIAVEKYHASFFKEADYREVARTDPWRTYWSLSAKEGKLFGVSPIDYSDEQRIIASWSSLYDKIYESGNCPGDDVIEDDDMLDGWMIIQKRLREESLEKKRGEEAFEGNDKIRNSDEIYIIAESAEDAKRIDALNDNVAKMLKSQRWETIKNRGVAKETDLPDVRNKYAAAAAQRIAHLMNTKG